MSKIKTQPDAIHFETAWSETARAKINLTLHVGAAQDDGFHPLHSLVVFADFGDELSGQIADKFSLKIKGPFAKDTPEGKANIIVKAASGIADNNDVIIKIAYNLNKRLPIASGMGGGSADAAAGLRMLSRANHVTWAEHAHSFLAIGADIPVCYLSRTCVMEGVGEQILPWPGLGQMAALLVNPGVELSTKSVFEKFDSVGVSSAFTLPAGSLLDMAKAGRNDLQAIAMYMRPVIGDVIAAIRAQTGCQLARMSGSGATCFGLFDSEAKAKQAAKALKKAQPDWWVMTTLLGDQP